jgi:hypothetical protein
MSSSTVGHLSRVHHLVVAGAASVMSVGVIAGVLTLFDRAGPAQWLQSSPEAAELLARCNEQPARAARQRCERETVAMLVQRMRAEARVARR